MGKILLIITPTVWVIMETFYEWFRLSRDVLVDTVLCIHTGILSVALFNVYSFWDSYYFKFTAVLDILDNLRFQ